VVTTGDAGTNVDVASAAADVVGPRAQGAATHLDDLERWRRLQARILAEPERSPLRLAFFNVHEAAARLLVERYPRRPRRRAHVLRGRDRGARPGRARALVERPPARGWKRGETNDPERRLHPSLVPWAELGEDERDEDREPVMTLPRMLALVGFELQRAPERA
jgi:hypothetical protein